MQSSSRLTTGLILMGRCELTIQQLFHLTCGPMASFGLQSIMLKQLPFGTIVLTVLRNLHY